MRTAILLLSLLAAAGTAAAITDADILNFALNLEYLEAEFYSCATTGVGLPASLRSGGPASIGCVKANLTGNVASIAAEIAADELAHVVFLRTALGAAAVPMPLINVGTGSTGAFSIAANAALNTTLSPPFSPYSNDITFLHGAFIFEDVGVTAYAGAAAAITNKDFLTAAAGILSVEAYHAGSVRKQLIQNSTFVVQPYGVEVNVIVNAISALRAALSGAADDQGILLNGTAREVPTDANGLTYTRTTSQVIAIVTAGAANGKGLFFPDGLNGVINGTMMAPAMAPMAGRKLLQSMAPMPGMEGMTAMPAMAPMGAMGPTMPTTTAAPALTDADILNFALNLEYLEASYYSWAVNGFGIPKRYRGGNGVVTGGMKANLTAPIMVLAKEIAADELDHVIFLRAALGKAAVPMPDMNIGTAFATAADVALNMTLSPAFSPYGSDLAFLFGSFIFEDVGVTAYKGAAALITDKAYLTAAASILAVEAYHAGAVRTLLYQNANTTVAPYGVPSSAITGAISALRAAASGAPDDVNVVDATTMGSSIVPTDSNAIVFSRTPAQVINIAILANSTGMGGFFPSGLNGVINGTASSVGSVASLDAATSPAGSPAGSAAGTPAAGTPAGTPATAPAGTPSAPMGGAFTAAAPSAVAIALGVASTLAMLL